MTLNSLLLFEANTRRSANSIFHNRKQYQTTAENYLPPPPKKKKKNRRKKLWRPRLLLDDVKCYEKEEGTGLGMRWGGGRGAGLRVTKPVTSKTFFQSDCDKKTQQQQKTV